MDQHLIEELLEVRISFVRRVVREYVEQASLKITKRRLPVLVLDLSTEDVLIRRPKTRIYLMLFGRNYTALEFAGVSTTRPATTSITGFDAQAHNNADEDTATVCGALTGSDSSAAMNTQRQDCRPL